MSKNLVRLGSAASIFILCACVSLAADRAAPTEGRGEDHHQHAMLACAKACSDCQRACDSCATHCAHLLVDGRKEHLATLQSCQDCADVCTAAAKIVARGGPLVKQTCQACAEACDLCARNCEKFPDDKHMKMCAEECRKCEKACREMIKHVS